MSNTATMLRKTEADLAIALSRVAELQQQLARALAELAVAKSGQSLAEAQAALADCMAHGDLDHINTCRGCGERSDTVWCVECAKQARCEHDQPLGDCTCCEVAADLAFDSWREDATNGGR